MDVLNNYRGLDKQGNQPWEHRFSLKYEVLGWITVYTRQLACLRKTIET